MNVPNNTSVLWLVVILLVFVEYMQAEVKLPAIVSSNMVLQRNTTVVLWGWADANEKIKIETSWLEKPLDIRANKEGNWRVEVQTTNDKQAQTINIKGASNTITLENVVFGEVWLCSGQSNMEQPIKGYIGQPVLGANMAIAKANNPNLRFFIVQANGSKTPLKDVKEFRAWEAVTPNTVVELSALAYFYGQQLQEILDVPVGIIQTSWGGSVVQAWISKEMINNYWELNIEKVDITKKTKQIPTALYNAMIHPLIPYTIKGALWYQGESDHKKPNKYKQLFPSMVKDWRSRWNIGDFPFYYVQISPYWYDNHEIYHTTDNSAFMREAQLQCLDLIPNSGIVITMDIGKEYLIHLPNKKEVADRLLYHALNKTYGFHMVDYASPFYKSHKVQGDEIVLSFENAERGLYTDGELKGFEIAGKDRVFYPAIARIVKHSNVVVRSDLVPNPVAVRYGWSNWVVGTLFDTYLLPASSFRTDKWENATRFK